MSDDNKALKALLDGISLMIDEKLKLAGFDRSVIGFITGANLENNTYTVQINGYEYVDLGLPSGLKWATCNIGANNPEETGDFYAWGDVEVYYTGKVYKFYKEEKGLDSDGFEYVYKGYTKYITKDKADQYGFKGLYDNKARLDMEDDVAYIKLGGTWRMPGMGDFKELLDTTNCLWEYVT